jgi:hypothetical protein
MVAVRAGVENRSPAPLSRVLDPLATIGVWAMASKQPNAPETFSPRREIGVLDALERIHLDRALVHAVAAADLDVRAHPNAYAEPDLAAPATLLRAGGQPSMFHGDYPRVGSAAPWGR